MAFDRWGLAKAFRDNQAQHGQTVTPIYSNGNVYNYNPTNKTMTPSAQQAQAATQPQSAQVPKPVSSPAQPSAPVYSATPNTQVGIRDTFENKGYKVNWNPSDKSVVLTSPSGVNSTLNEGDYQNNDGTTYISQDRANSILNQVPPLDPMRKLIQDRIDAQIKARQGQTEANVKALQQSFNNTMGTIRDNRVLEDLQFNRHNNPYSGGTDYRKAVMDRQRTIADAQAQQQLGMQIGQIQQGLSDYTNNQQSLADSMYMDEIRRAEDNAFRWSQIMGEAVPAPNYNPMNFSAAAGGLQNIISEIEKRVKEGKDVSDLVAQLKQFGVQ